MCLTCSRNHPSIQGKEELEQLFYPKLSKELRALRHSGLGVSGHFVHSYDNEEVELTHKRIDEIINHALAVIATGIDNRIDIWAIQWPRDYHVKTF